MEETVIALNENQLQCRDVKKVRHPLALENNLALRE